MCYYDILLVINVCPQSLDNDSQTDNQNKQPVSSAPDSELMARTLPSVTARSSRAMARRGSLTGG